MTDVSKMIEPKSDQLNYDDLIAGPITATITAVDVRNTREQPISVHFDCFPRPWKPCKSMARVMAAVWGRDSAAWVGHGVTLYGDPDVKWAGVAVGGIRISHLTGINSQQSFNITVSKGKRKPVVISPLQQATPQAARQPVDTQPQQSQQHQDPTQAEIAHFGQLIMGADSMDKLAAIWQQVPPAARQQLSTVKDQAKSALSAQHPSSQPDTGIESF